ncbi:glycosyl hydrolase [Desulfosarcina ovata subsp. sediminis]|uniref:Glycosyl hydrolase n=1 Tax=Desulfosarcina ovata subsp. sediminis TaxID=885957 RepID=A0A5K7ZXW8_9BACT|nr:glycosyl hydrolase [Desulfosarcina ovata subsp. sediminis]
MINCQRIALLIPACNEAESLPKVLSAWPHSVDRLIVIDNGSTDGTARIARDFGAEVVHEPRHGYGSACLRGLARLALDPPDIVAFADADGSDDLACLEPIIDPIAENRADFVLSRRVPTTPRALTPQQRFGNWLATRLIRVIWDGPYRDLGPMRAVRWRHLVDFKMRDPDYGWTVEMQIRALHRKCRIQEVAVPYRPRVAGRSQVSGTLAGVFGAGVKILWIIGREALEQPRRHRRRKN